MQYTNDTWADINSGAGSALGIILEELNHTKKGNFAQSIPRQEGFANSYSAAKREVFLQMGNYDFNFCIYEDTMKKSTNSNGETIYEYPSNFLRFLLTDTYNKNKQIRKDDLSTFSYPFKYIGYTKDSNTLTNNAIPNEANRMIAYLWLGRYERNEVSFEQKRAYLAFYQSQLMQAKQLRI